MSILIGYSPLDAILDALPELRKAGKVSKGDDVLSVQQRMADVLRPIVKRIQSEAVKKAEAERDAALAIIRKALDAGRWNEWGARAVWVKEYLEEAFSPNEPTK